MCRAVYKASWCKSNLSKDNSGRQASPSNWNAEGPKAKSSHYVERRARNREKLATHAWVGDMRKLIEKLSRMDGKEYKVTPGDPKYT